MHGHVITVRLEVTGPVRQPQGWIIDYADLRQIWKLSIEAEIDHRCLNNIEGLDNPTTEHLAPWIAERLRPALEVQGVRLVRLVLDEGLDSGVTWTPEETP